MTASELTTYDLIYNLFSYICCIFWLFILVGKKEEQKKRKRRSNIFNNWDERMKFIQVQNLEKLKKEKKKLLENFYYN